MKIRAIFCTHAKLGSYLIRAVTDGPWSHVVIMDGNDGIEAVWPKVRRAPLEELLPSYLQYAIVEYEVEDSAGQLAMRFWRKQIGKRYDVAALAWLYFGRLLKLLGFTRSWADPNKWFCDELFEAGMRLAGRPLVRISPADATPYDLWKSTFGEVIGASSPVFTTLPDPGQP